MIEMDDILKAYGKRTNFDDWYEIMDYDPELGFNPRFWVPRSFEETQRLTRKIFMRMQTDELLRGQAFGL